MIIYIQWYKPFDKRATNLIETFNEVSIITLTYFLFCFTDFVPEPETRNNLGVYYNSITYFNISVHMIIMLCSSFHKIRLKCKKRRHANKIKKLM